MRAIRQESAYRHEQCTAWTRLPGAGKVRLSSPQRFVQRSHQRVRATLFKLHVDRWSLARAQHVSNPQTISQININQIQNIAHETDLYNLYAKHNYLLLIHMQKGTQQKEQKNNIIHHQPL